MEIKTKLGKRVVDDSTGEILGYLGEKVFTKQNCLSYLDPKAFESGDGVCYIPDIAFVEHRDKHPEVAPDFIPIAEIKAKFVYDRPKLIQAFGGDEEVVKSIIDNLMFARPEVYKSVYDSMFGNKK